MRTLKYTYCLLANERDKLVLMSSLTRTPRLGAALYAELCSALKTARDWNASASEIDVIRKAIQNRESVDVLSSEEKELITRIISSYAQRSRPGHPRKRAKPVREAVPVETDLGHLSFIADSEADKGPPGTQSI